MHKMFKARGFLISKIVIVVCFIKFQEAIPNVTSLNTNNVYYYFAFGSNMEPTTMTALRNVNPLSSTAAILPNHSLRFNVPGTPLLEPSWASVEPCLSNELELQNEKKFFDARQNVVHGVLYKLNQNDFRTVCRTEGVPFAYSLHQCNVIPYLGDGKDAGQRAYHQAVAASNYSSTVKSKRVGISAFTLRAASTKVRNEKDIPPSSSYLSILIKGAKEFRIDSEYVDKLQRLPIGRTIGNGFSEGMLKTAVTFSSFQKNLSKKES